MKSFLLPLFAALALWISPACGQDAAPVPATVAAAEPVKVEHIWVVFKTHFDLGYTDLAENVFTKYRVNMMEGALKVIEENRAQPKERQFVWTVPGWPLARAILDRETDPVKRGRIEAAIREGSLALHAMPGTLHTESLDLEDLVRGLSFSSRLARDYGRPLPISAKLTDVPEHSWVLPTVLARAGVRFVQIGCNSACQYPRVPRLFWWEGPDGSRVLCNYTVDYGSGVVPPRDWPSRNYLAMIMTGDNHGPPTPAEVERVRSEVAKHVPGATMSFGTLDDFARAVLEEKPALSVVRGDTPDSWIHGLMSMPEATRIARNVRPLVPALDSLDTHLRLAGLTPPPLGTALAEAYENSMLYGEHTWGMNGAFGGRDIWPMSAWFEKVPVERQVKFFQSFEDHRNYIRKTRDILERGLKERLDLLARSVNATGRRVVVYNALPWARSGQVEIEGRTYVAENVPHNGYKVLPARESAMEAKPVSLPSAPAGGHPVLEKEYFRATFDLNRGGIASLVEKSTGREWVDASSPYILGQYLHERFSKREVDRFFKAYSRMPGGWALDDLGKPGMPEAEPLPPDLQSVHATAPGQPNPGAMGKEGLPKTDYATTGGGDWKLTVVSTPAGHEAELVAGDTRGLAKGLRLIFRFPRNAPGVEVEWSVADKTPDKMPEGGWLCFPFAVKKPVFTAGRPGAPIDPARDILPGANRHLYAVSTGVTVSSPDGGAFSLCPLDSPLVSLGKPGLWSFSMDYVPEIPTVFVNLYNNMWNTNFPLWQDGSWSERVRLWSGADLVTPSWEARLPLLGALADGPPGALPVEQGGLSVSRAGVLVTAFGANPDGQGTLLRVWDQSGEDGEVVVTLPGTFKTATPVNLRGETAGQPVRISNGDLTFNLPAYAPASFVLNPKEQP